MIPTTSMETVGPHVCKAIKPLYKTKSGSLYCGDSLSILKARSLNRLKGKINLVFTSPPFPLNRKKRYGNLQGEEYVQWLASLAPILAEFLTATGSIVIELGNAWEPGQPTMSTLPIEALLAFKKAANLNLCQEFICFNPARLPSPAQWVNVERIRVKDAFTRVWWLSATATPKADNKKILTKYSKSMQELFKRGTYNAGLRPSEHNIGEKSFLTNNKGAIPPNVLVPPIEDMLPELTEVLSIANTFNSDLYQSECRLNDWPSHPARMPRKLVEFFVEFLTEPGDRVLDPFAGSNTTGAVAESLLRKWVGIEMRLEYAETSKIRFGLPCKLPKGVLATE